MTRKNTTYTQIAYLVAIDKHTKK